MTAREGGLDAPTRHPIPWQEADYTDAGKLDAELRRVFDICHGCRRCFNLCGTFPRLFELIDEAPSGELDTVASEDFAPAIEACTLCDMCFMTKCPYVPPHAFDLDFPHLMLRARATRFARGEVGPIERRLSETDANGRMATALPTLANWACRKDNRLARAAMEKVAGIDRRADLPAFNAGSLVARAKAQPRPANAQAPAYGRRAVLYATCFCNWNDAAIGEAARRVLAHNGVDIQVLHPACCGMPKLEQGDLAAVAARARRVAAALLPHIEAGCDIVAPVPSCALMLKFEWPLLLPEDAAIRRLAQATRDASEYVVEIAAKEGLMAGMAPPEGAITLHIACHARAQNMGAKAAEMLRLLPSAQVDVVERCSGHGGIWGMKKASFDLAMKVGAPTVRRAARRHGDGSGCVASECPLAAAHIRQGIAETPGCQPPPALHPIQIVARAYGFAEDTRQEARP